MKKQGDIGTVHCFLENYKKFEKSKRRGREQGVKGWCEIALQNLNFEELYLPS